ncbi:hypothetical protein SKA34_08653 [Photobacterium sp. SKA34]|nr:hypothetical protein SKA34_08653 [Photobacterium sp. SKA34]
MDNLQCQFERCLKHALSYYGYISLTSIVNSQLRHRKEETDFHYKRNFDFFQVEKKDPIITQQFKDLQNKKLMIKKTKLTQSLP